jgi:hypothetical protein
MKSYKTVKERKECYIELSDEEIKELGWKENQRLSFKVNNDGSISIQPWVNIDLDIQDWPREILLMLIEESLATDKPVNDVIVDIIKKSLNIQEDGNV